MIDDSQKRFVTKSFYCEKCKNKFKKLVHISCTNISCPKCNFNFCNEKTEENDENETNDCKIRKHILSMIRPFSKSPFANSIKRSHLDFSDILDDQIISTPTEDFFIDNYSSNFFSNFFNPLTRIVYVQIQKKGFENETSPPLNTKQIRQIKKFNLEEFHCKKLENNKFEKPNCLYCLKDIEIGNPTYLLRCGHLYHKECITEWISKHSICPMCKFDIVSKSQHKSSIDKVNEKENKENSDVKKTLLKNEDNFEQIDVKKRNSNINIMGFSKDLFELIN